MPASRTAQYVALYRALETVERGRPPLFHDPYAIRFLSPGLVRAVRAARVPAIHAMLSRYADHRAPGARTSAIARTKVIDDAVRDRGTPQLVILGAGFDCRAHRLPELAATDVFEVDRPQTQARKRDLLPAGRPVHYVPVDFRQDDVAGKLTEAGWNPSLPTCFLWEGVTNYLDSAAVAQVLSWVGRSAPGSTLVFTYVHQALLDGTQTFPGGAKILANVRTLNEPWTFGILPQELRAYLSPFHLTLRENLSADDYRARVHLPDPTGYSFYHLAIADHP